MKVLITGGAGFIGSFIVDELLERDHKVSIFDNLELQVHMGKMPEYANLAASWILSDIRDYNALKQTIANVNPEIIFHKAAAVGVSQSQYQIKKYVDVNVGGTANLLDILVNHKNRVQKLIVAASMSSYGEGKYECSNCGVPDNLRRTEEQLAQKQWELFCPQCGTVLEPRPTDESWPRRCNSIYAITKRDQEEMCMTIGKTYGIPVVALRYFNVYGPRQSLSNPYTGVVAIFMSRLKNDNPPIVYEDGLQSRDFVSVHDIVQANMLALENDEANYQVFNVGTGKPCTIKGIAETLAKLYGKDIAPTITNEYRKGDIRHCYADISKIQKLGYVPKISFEDGMTELIQWSKTVTAKDTFESATHELRARGLL
jgi:dTDP-L-rhamnose 4-epimerase